MISIPSSWAKKNSSEYLELIKASLKERIWWSSSLVASLMLFLAWMQWGRSLSWDELEFFRATRWVGYGQVPYVDFWEHHSPLQWFLMAPLAILMNAPGASTIIWMRWGQFAFWTLGWWAFWRLLSWEKTAVWVRYFSLSLLLLAPFFTLWAVEFRPDTLGTAFMLGGIAIWRTGRRKMAPLVAGALLSMAGLANLRLVPVAGAVALVLLFTRPASRRWGWNLRSPWLMVGTAIPVMLGLEYLIATSALQSTWHHLVVENAWFNKMVLSQDSSNRLSNSFVLPFKEGDIAGSLLCILGIVQTYFDLRKFRRPDLAFLLAEVQLFQLASILRLGVWYPYHTQGFLVVAALQGGLAIGRLAANRDVDRRMQILGVGLVGATGLLACYHLAFSNFHGTLKFQNSYMASLERVVPPESPVLDGVGFGFNREPASHPFWFISTISRALSLNGRGHAYDASDFYRRPPGAVVITGRMNAWLMEWPQMRSILVRNYLPENPFLWLPAMNALIQGKSTEEWRVLFSGRFHILASQAFASHPWFFAPLSFSGFVGPFRNPYTLEMTGQTNSIPIDIEIDVSGKRVSVDAGSIQLAKGDSLAVRNSSTQPMGVFILPENSPMFFQGRAQEDALDTDLFHFNVKSNN
jgi:hypothetical protein